MKNIISQSILSHTAVLTMITAAVQTAESMNCPLCIVIVDATGQLLAEFRMPGARFLSRKSALSKALTAASNGAPSAGIPEHVRQAIGMATNGKVTGLAGGLPVLIDGEKLGGIGIGSGTPDQDLAVANAALVSIEAETFV